MDCNPPDFNQFYEVGGPRNWPAPLDISKDYNDTHYENNYWQSQSPGKSVGSYEKESVESYDWKVIPIDEE